MFKETTYYGNYRNGYGIEKNEEKGIYWLQKAAALDYKPAEIELAEAQPENASPNQTKTESPLLPPESFRVVIANSKKLHSVTRVSLFLLKKRISYLSTTSSSKCSVTTVHRS